MVRDTDGSAFITKAEFDSLKNNFQAQIDNYNSSIDSKIDGAIAAYLAGVMVSTEVTIDCLYNQYKFNGQANTLGTLTWGRKFGSTGPLSNSGDTANTMITGNILGFTSQHGMFWSPKMTVNDQSAPNIRYLLRSKNADGTANISKIQNCHPTLDQKICLFFPELYTSANDPWAYGETGRVDSFGRPEQEQWTALGQVLNNKSEFQIDYNSDFTVMEMRYTYTKI